MWWRGHQGVCLVSKTELGQGRAWSQTSGVACVGGAGSQQEDDRCFCADMIRRRSLRTRAIKMLVLDEADEMLNKGRSEPGPRTLLALPGQLISAPCAAQASRSRSTTCTATCLQPRRWS